MGFLASSTPVLLLLLLSSLFLLRRLPLAVAADISLGSTLTPSGSSSWTSDNKTFSLGFVSDTDNPSLYLAAITYSGVIRVWTAAGADNNPVAVDSAASLQLRSDGDLRLTNGSGAVVWQSNTSNKGVTAASLGENGDLVLNNGSASVWQSFSHPTDTIVENQNFTIGQTLRSGIYTFSLNNTGNLTLTWNDSVFYFNQGFNSSFTANKTLTFPVLTLQTNGIVSLSDESLSTSVVIAYSSDYGESGVAMRFVRLDSDGNLRAYSVDSGTTSAIDRWSAVADQCEVFGWCGNMGICSYNDTSPVCGCASENFVLVDPNDSRKGCKRKVAIEDCPGNSTMLQLDHSLFLTYPPDITTERFFVGITACRLNCLSGSSCVASTSLADGSGYCYLKVSNFVSGYLSQALPSTSFVKVCAPAVPNQPPPASDGIQTHSSQLKGWVVAVVVLGTILVLMALEWGLYWCFCRNSPKYGPSSAQYALLEYASGAPVQFSYRELHRSTKGFKEKLGAGGFGAVYRGDLANRTVVAVKQLEGIEQGEKQFRMEVATISSTHHLNLVRLIGFCSEGRHRLLVYEFMKNGSLDSFLFCRESSGKLNWATRFSVAIGTARGITYLHEECRDCIVHCDIKPENILLDENYNAKVSDFGLAKLIHPKDHRHRTLTSVRGTRGYLAPEWLANLPITSKSDVYSYGMVLLEIVSGRRNFDVSEETGRKKFSIWAYEEFENGNIRNIMDKSLAEQEVDMEQLERAVQVSFWCTQEQPSLRPSMGKVVQMLEGIMEIERPPAPKATDCSVNITSGTLSASTITTFAASGPPTSLSSAYQTTGDTSSISRRNLEKASSSLLASDQSAT
ncbi:G-type lectin S-receptor-like serine/threonine-protein kinase At1g34300 [Elaeis guineensis]|uniref:Receptor-like serine/threonine-protein kinase n=1 Tax=Elaeis guineensis var. tenera TaxID=51953 RepID=A0A8N4I6T2_ELAGV|nr:G-type lectin S-receptor-like serine/threonine-protein kinase At1g34300 [Elaeis guineensis]